MLAALALTGCDPFLVGDDPPAATLKPVAGPGVRVAAEEYVVRTRIQGDRGYAAWITDAGVQVVGIDLATNTLAWSAHELGSAKEVTSLMALPDALVLTTHRFSRQDGSADGVVVLDPASGATRWMADYDSTTDGVTFYPDAVVLGSRKARTTRGLDWRTGATRWTIPDPATGKVRQLSVTTGEPSALVPDPLLYLVGDDRVLRSYDVRTGKATATVTLPGGFESPTVVGRTLVATRPSGDPGTQVMIADLDGARPPRSMHQIEGKRRVSVLAGCGAGRICLAEDGAGGVAELRAFDASSGQQLWRAQAPRDPHTSLAMAGDRVVYAGSVFAPDGRTLHRGADAADGTYSSLGRASDARLVGLSARIGRFPVSPVATEVAWVSPADGARRVLGSVSASPGSCSWSDRFLLCAGAESFGVYPLT
ncbi:hypothetical protein Lfu02_58070 [Longispora fulva]|nr:hypothetical protein Lfu02_58070 [Longispora fulva]